MNQQPLGPVRVLGIVGSLRRESFNRKLMHAARELAPPTLAITTFEIGVLPLYNADLDVEGSWPEPAQALRQAVIEADALLIASPEYNHGIPGGLQNAIDWASRPNMRSPLVAKPVAIMGASNSSVGSARAQQSLKLVLLSTLAHLMPHAGVVVGLAPEKFDAQGALTHEKTRVFLAAFLREFEAWARRMGPAAPRQG